MSPMYKKAKFELHMRKKMAFQYMYYFLVVENITFSCFASSARVPTNGTAGNYVLLKFSRNT